MKRYIWSICAGSFMIGAALHGVHDPLLMFMQRIVGKDGLQKSKELETRSKEIVQRLPVQRTSHFEFGPFEQPYIQARRAVAHAALQRFNTEYVPAVNNTTIGVALSGGGYRAMTCSFGYLKGIEELHLLDGITHISSLSGSTWCVAPWLFFNQLQGYPVSIRQYYDEVLSLIHAHKYDPFSVRMGRHFNFSAFMSSVMLPKKKYNQPFNVVDLYGALLSNVLLQGWGDEKKFTLNLYDQREIPQSYGLPWPLYTAVSMHKNISSGEYAYDWYEFGPDMVRNSSLTFSIPAYALNMRYASNGTLSALPTLSFCSLFGLFGSAFTVNARDIERILFPPIELSDLEVTDDVQEPAQETKKEENKLKALFAKVSDTVREKIGKKIVEVLVARTASLEVGKKRFSPMEIYNPWYGWDMVKNYAWMTQRATITMVDAGIDYNIPLLPLLVPERSIGLIIVGDASGNVPEGDVELQKGLRSLKAQGMNYVQDRAVYADQEKYGYVSKKCVKVYRPSEIATATRKLPIIVYVNFLKDDELIRLNSAELQTLIAHAQIEKFNPIACLSNACGTSNFAYPATDFIGLAGIAQFNIMAHKKLLQALVAHM